VWAKEWGFWGMEVLDDRVSLHIFHSTLPLVLSCKATDTTNTAHQPRGTCSLDATSARAQVPTSWITMLHIPHAMPAYATRSLIVVFLRSHQLLTAGLAQCFRHVLDPSERLMQLTGILHTPAWWPHHLHVTDNRFSLLSQHASDAGRSASRPSSSTVAR
jgi:hypothetical protein